MKPKHENRQNEYETLEKQILSLYYSGIYISSYDIVQLGKNIGYELPLKERNILFSKLLGDAKKDNKIKNLFVAVSNLIKHRAMQYTELGNLHPYARPMISIWLQKAKATDLLIKREMGA
ncbi:MAG: hypothetical protein PHE73_00020 [Sulfurovaceae bacterium]|nr:hypothetical protein [Sulfurovaceae bacterium]